MFSIKKLQVAIIGCGAIYDVHAEAIVNSEYAEITYVVDIDETKAKYAAKKYNCKYDTNYKSILSNNEIDLMHICTPHYLHADMAINAMKSGKHVFCEKPISINTIDARHMIKESIKTNMKLGICFQNRYNDTTIKMKEIIDSGVLGLIKGVRSIVTWHRNSEYYTKSNWKGKYETEGGGVLINQAIHTIDLIQYLCGSVDSVDGNIDTRILSDTIEVEDTADATMILSSGARWLFYATNCYITDDPVDIQIYFEEGVLRLIDNELLLKKDGTTEIIASDNSTNFKHAKYWGNSHTRAINKFYKSIIDKNYDYITGEDAIKSLYIIEKIVKSSNEKDINLALTNK